ncbi:hypothetical protein HDU87_008612 [Geranomyces variabilis]|uniref:Protein PBN1 n=1 Tax=Geranomyces variabilis TaxID=109894 RepID=A0AAD5XTE1_9FUNG|nr:hypothetical protein HDU87_008612 [Geranomyces variabilis]
MHKHPPAANAALRWPSAAHYSASGIDVSADTSPGYGFHQHARFNITAPPSVHPPQRGTALAIFLQFGRDAFADRYEIARTTWPPAVSIRCCGDADLEVAADSPAARENSVIAWIQWDQVPTNKTFQLDVPFHMRYLPPEIERRHMPAQAPMTNLFVINSTATAPPSCDALSLAQLELHSLATWQCDRDTRGIQMPVGRAGDAEWVGVLTCAVVLLGVAIVLRELLFLPKPRVQDLDKLKTS